MPMLAIFLLFMQGDLFRAQLQWLASFLLMCCSPLHGFDLARSKAVVTWLCLVSMSLVSPLASAHEGRPVFIELTASELSANDTVENTLRYEVRWKIPPVIAEGLEPSILLVSDSCALAPGLANQRYQPKLIGRLIYHCASSPESLAIAIRYPESNPALSSLIVSYDRHGNSQHIFSAPEQALVSIPTDSSIKSIASQYTLGGIKHILVGFDHLFFVVCLMVIAGSFTRLLIAVTGFTLAHTITLVLAALNMVVLPMFYVEILIALSVVVLAAEIIRVVRTEQSSASPSLGYWRSLTWRYPILAAIGFGFLHGFGFAGVLSELGLPMAMKTTALLFFNLGVELGQLIFIVVTLLLVWALRQALGSALQQKVVYAGVYCVGIIATYWMLQRLILPG
jgi:hypothetical protein